MHTAATLLDPPVLAADDRLDRFLAGFQPVFPRADQFRRFRAYVRGLLAPGLRRSAQAMAERAAAADENLTQALQHFVSHSPWDADALTAAYRRALPDGPQVWVVHDGAFAKKGRHSVGVYRQLDRAAGRKQNCQVAAVVSAVGRAGVFPLAVRLYLPAQWLRDSPAAGRVPEPYRQPRTKPELAADLLAGLRAEGRTPAAVVLDDGYAAGELPAAVAGWGWAVTADPAAREAAVGRFEWLKGAVGLDHFEGRAWVGWHHHVALALVAAGYLAAHGERPA